MKIKATVRVFDSSKPVEIQVELRGVQGNLYLLHENQKKDHAIVPGLGEVWDGEQVIVEIRKIKKV